MRFWEKYSIIEGNRNRVWKGERRLKNNKQPEKVAVAVDKDKALATALAQIEKQFGKGAIMRLGQNEAMQVEAI